VAERELQAGGGHGEVVAGRPELAERVGERLWEEGTGDGAEGWGGMGCASRVGKVAGRGGAGDVITTRQERTGLRCYNPRMAAQPHPGHRVLPEPMLDPLRASSGRKPWILGVAGGTGAGKSTLVRSILEAAGPDRIAVIEHDSYYRDIEWRSEADLLQYNFDHPSALDTSLLVAHLAALKAGHPVEVPTYDFVRHRRTSRTRRVMPLPLVVLEGILIFVEPDLREMLDLKLFVDTDADVRLIRRLGRDMSERGRSVQDVLRQYLQTVRPMHLEFVEPSKRWADLIIPAGSENKVALDMVVAQVEKLLGEA
jgi:uridine kinase